MLCLPTRLGAAARAISLPASSAACLPGCSATWPFFQALCLPCSYLLLVASLRRRLACSRLPRSSHPVPTLLSFPLILLQDSSCWHSPAYTACWLAIRRVCCLQPWACARTPTGEAQWGGVRHVAVSSGWWCWTGGRAPGRLPVRRWEGGVRRGAVELLAVRQGMVAGGRASGRLQVKRRKVGAVNQRVVRQWAVNQGAVRKGMMAVALRQDTYR